MHFLKRIFGEYRSKCLFTGVPQWRAFKVYPALSDKILMNYEVRIKVFETGFVSPLLHPLILAPNPTNII